MVKRGCYARVRENYNGTGVPRQLKGKAISPFAQIVHIVETLIYLFRRIISKEVKLVLIRNFSFGRGQELGRVGFLNPLNLGIKETLFLGNLNLWEP